jgi:alanyl-tRNA synthetase
VAPASGLKAGDLIKDAAKQVGGGGGGKGDIATAGGKNPAALDDALMTATKAVEAARRS